MVNAPQNPQKSLSNDKPHFSETVMSLGNYGSVARIPNDSAALEAAALSCEYRINPLGIESSYPRLSWKIYSARANVYQTAYRILAATGPDLLQEGKANLWDSGKVESSESILIPYSGRPLRSLMECYWKVMIWDTHSRCSAWSAAAYWSMGLLDKSDWKAQWIGTAKEETSAWLRKTFVLPFPPKKATIFVNVQGYYELYVNGRKAGEEVLSPAVSNFSKRTYYLTYDITGYLQQGQNCLGVWLGRGWYRRGLPGVVHHSPVARIQCILTEEDDTTRQIVSDSGWKTHSSSYCALGKWFWNEMGGERYDVNRDIPHWNMPYYDDSHWEDALVVCVPDVPATSQICPGNRIGAILPAARVEPLPEHRYLIDFATNLTGWAELRFKNLKKGQVIKLTYADLDQRREGQGFQSMGQGDELVSAGNAQERFVSKFNYHGFRYVLIEGLDYPPEPSDAQAWLIESDLPQVGEFSCSHALFNQIHNTVMWTFRCLNLGGYQVDCPHRERMGYGGDGLAGMHSACMHFYVPSFYAKWQQNWCDDLSDDGELPNASPAYYPAGGGPIWGGFAIVNAWKLYQYYGDRRILESSWETMRGYLDFLESKTQDDILQHYGDPFWGSLGDWVSPGHEMGHGLHDALVPKRVDDLSRIFFNNCTRVYLWDIVRRVAEVLGLGPQERQGREKLENLRSLLHTRYYQPEQASYANGEQPYLAFPLLVGVTPEALQEKVFQNLERTIRIKDKGHLNTGMSGTEMLLCLLMQKGRDDLINLIARQTTYPSWGHMLKNGATTLWEQWDGYWSQIHACFLSIGVWFYQGLGGIKPDNRATAFKRFFIQPAPVDGVDWAKTRFESLYGTIRSEWTVTPDGFMELIVEVPSNTRAAVILPLSCPIHSAKSNPDIHRGSGIKILKRHNDQVSVEIPSGTYRFHVPLAEVEHNPAQPPH